MQSKIISWAETACDRLMEWRQYPSAAHLKAPLLIAHRGAWTFAVENTLAAFTRAKAAGLGGIELDIHFTSDNVPVVHHDPTLGRLHGRDEAIAALTFVELRRLAPAVPSFGEVVAIGGLHLMIEIKTALTPTQIHVLEETLQNLRAVRDFHLLSLQPELVRESAAFPANCWILVGQVQMRQLVEIAIAHGYAGAAGHYLGMTQALVTRLHERRLGAGVGFVSSVNLLNREWARGVDWVFTNTAEAFARG